MAAGVLLDLGDLTFVLFQVIGCSQSKLPQNMELDMYDLPKLGAHVCLTANLPATMPKHLQCLRRFGMIPS